MSRYEVTMDNGHTFAYGYDHPLQTYFWQTFDEDGECLVDEGGLQPRTGVDLIMAIEKYGVKDIVNPAHIQLAGLDLPIE